MTKYKYFSEKIYIRNIDTPIKINIGFLKKINIGVPFYIK